MSHVGRNVAAALHDATEDRIIAAGLTLSRYRELARQDGKSISSLELAQVSEATGVSVDDLLFLGDDKGRIEYLERCCDALVAYKSDLAARLRAIEDIAGKCENFTLASAMTCRDDPSRSFDAEFSAERLCLPCRVAHIIESPRGGGKETP